MEEKKEFVPTLTEWDELVLLWNRSQAMFASRPGAGVTSRVAWVTKNFVETHQGSSHRLVWAWLTRSLEIARTSAPVFNLRATASHDETTAVYRIPRSTPHDHVTEALESAMAPRSSLDRQG